MQHTNDSAIRNDHVQSFFDTIVTGNQSAPECWTSEPSAKELPNGRVITRVWANPNHWGEITWRVDHIRVRYANQPSSRVAKSFHPEDLQDAKRPSEMSVTDFSEWELISSYFRAQAVADGVLIYVTKLEGKAGFRYPVALTSAAWHDCVAVASTDHVHDETGRLWDVLNVLRFRIRTNPDGSEIHFSVDVADESEQITRVWLKCLCGPGDDAEPVLTVMLPEED